VTSRASYYECTFRSLMLVKVCKVIEKSSLMAMECWPCTPTSDPTLASPRSYPWLGITALRDRDVDVALINVSTRGYSHGLEHIQ
jgi:hypothetical protein